jgi:2-polyprenyl-3-methyl-5-hydroxy-6-metoxy-1,4-benzoquinol methylase
MNTFKEEEKGFLEGLFNKYITSNDSSYLRLMRELMIKKCKPYIKEGAYALELGCEIGYMTSLISSLVAYLDVLDGSKSFIVEAKKRNLKNVVFYNMLFEELSVKNKYDCIFMSHVVEHLIDPKYVLEKVKDALVPGGFVFIAVPNGRALSRQLAKSMGLIDDLYALTPNDIRGGHRRIYDMVSIEEEVVLAGLEIREISGVLVKPFCDIQMDFLIDTGFLKQEHLTGMMKLGTSYSDICGDIFVCATK